MTPALARRVADDAREHGRDFDRELRRARRAIRLSAAAGSSRATPIPPPGDLPEALRLALAGRLEADGFAVFERAHPSGADEYEVGW